MNTSHTRQLIRAACGIHQGLLRRTREASAAALPSRLVAECQRQGSLLELARSRHWHAAAALYGHQLRRSLEDLNRQVWASIDELNRPQPRRPPALRDVYDDLAGLELEFPAVRVDLASRKLAVATEPVVLEGVYLGRFEIVFDWQAFAEREGCYEVVALDACASSVDDAVTHPHVRDNDLCEGDASSGIRAAFESGRIFDFFVIVTQTLATYNPGSAYVSLDQWQGQSCADCGGTIHEDDTYSCERCECTLCESCGGGCTDCGRTVCSECDLACAGCHENHCASCLSRCRSCTNHYCERCLSDEQCQSCREAKTSREAQANPEEASSSGDSALPLCVGEADVSA